MLCINGILIKRPHLYFILFTGLYAQMSSGNAVAMNKMAQNRNLPFVSYTSSAPALSDVEMFPNFMRTIPPDGPLTKVSL